MSINPYESPREVDAKDQSVCWRPTVFELLVLWAASGLVLSICLPNPHLVPRWLGIASLIACTGLTVLLIGIAAACALIRIIGMFEKKPPAPPQPKIAE
jgi:hypothetical protein